MDKDGPSYTGEGRKNHPVKPKANVEGSKRTCKGCVSAWNI